MNFELPGTLRLCPIVRPKGDALIEELDSVEIGGNRDPLNLGSHEVPGRTTHRKRYHPKAVG